MLNPEQMDRLIAAMRNHGVTRLEVARGTRRMVLDLPETAAAGPADTDPPAPASVVHIVPSPGIGQFVPRGGDDGLPPLPPGAAVTPAEVLGYIAQGPLCQILAAPAAGTLTGPLPEAGQVFGPGDPVLTLEATP